jgi:hypothetical protein
MVNTHLCDVKVRLAKATANIYEAAVRAKLTLILYKLSNRTIHVYGQISHTCVVCHSMTAQLYETTLV